MKAMQKLFVITWACFLLLVWLIFFVILPRKGFDFTDHGYYLYNSLLILRGIIPSYGYGASINSLFMFFDLRNYLFFELVYFLLIMLSVFVFWISLDSLKNALFLPLVLIVALCLRITYIASYQNAAEIFLLVALSVMFFSYRTPGWISRVLLIISSLCFLLSSLSNAALLPAVPIVFFFVLLFFHKTNKKHSVYFYIPFIIFSIVLILFYVSSPLSLFKAANLSAYQHTTMLEPLRKIPSVIGMIFQPLFSVFFVLGLLLRFFFAKKKVIFEFLSPLLFLLLMILSFSTSFINMNFQALGDAIVSIAFSLLQLLILANLYFYDGKVKSLKLFFASILIVIYSFGLALTSRSAAHYHLGLFPGASIAVISLYFNFATKHDEGGLSVLSLIYFVILLFFMVLCLIAFVGYNYRAYSIFSHKTLIEKGVFRGVYANEQKIKTLDVVTGLYNKYECNNKPFFAYPALPLVYYYFNRKAPLDKPWVSFGFQNIKNADIISYLNTHKHWCVMVAPGFNGDVLGYTSDVQHFLEKNSTHQVDITVDKKPSGPSFYPWQFSFYSR